MSTLEKMIRDKDVEGLINALEDSPSEGVIEILGKIGDKRAVDILIQMTRNQNYGVCEAAALALNNFDGEVEALLKDKNHEIRWEASKLFGWASEDVRAVEPLIGFLTDGDNKIRGEAAETLGYIRDSRAIQPLISALGDEDKEVREYVAKALARIGGEETAITLEEASVKDDEKKILMACALWARRDVAGLLDEIKIDNEHSIVWNALTDIGDASVVNPILRMLSHTMATYDINGNIIEDSVSDIDFEATYCLSSMRKRGIDISPVIDYFLMELNRASTYEESSRAIGILQSISEQSVANAFIEILNSSKEGDKRWLVAGALGDLYDRTNYPRIGQALLNALSDEDSTVREYSAQSLGNIKEIKAVKPLINLLEDTDYFVRCNAAYALSEIGDVQAIEPLIKVLDDVKEYVREGAAKALGRFGKSIILLLIKAKKRGKVNIDLALEEMPPAAVGAEFEKLELYDDANEWYNSQGMLKEAADARRRKADLAAPKTEIHGDYVDDRDTIVKDSVINRSNVGAGGKSKSEELREAKALLDDGIIDDDEFKQMKKEILGK